MKSYNLQNRLLISILFTFISSNFPSCSSDTQESSNDSTPNRNTSEDSTIGSREVDAASEMFHDDSPQGTMVSIPMQQYRKLINSTVELYRANNKIKILAASIENKDVKIKRLETELEKANITIKEKFSSAGFSEVRV